MKRAAVLLTLALSACAHGSSGTGGAHLAAQPHQTLRLEGPSGLEEQQASILEGTICQVLVELNHGDVVCPSSVRAALQLLQARSAVGADDQAAQQSVLDEAHRAGREVHAAVEKAGAGFQLTLTYIEAPGGPVQATRAVKADDFDGLLERAPDATRSLLQ